VNNPTEHATARLVLDAACRLFAHKGFAATSVREITLDCNITQAAMYRYFDSKDTVLYELIRLSFQYLMESLEQASAETESQPAAQRLDQLVESYLNYATTHTLLARVASQEWSRMRGPEREEFSGFRRTVRGYFSDVINDGIEHGVFSLSVPNGQSRERTLKLTTTAVLDTCSGVFVWYEADGEAKPEHLVELYKSIVRRIVNTETSADHLVA
jgi:AcrR family transcriptional regulator